MVHLKLGHLLKHILSFWILRHLSSLGIKLRSLLFRLHRYLNRLEIFSDGPGNIFSAVIACELLLPLDNILYLLKPFKDHIRLSTTMLTSIFYVGVRHHLILLLGTISITLQSFPCRMRANRRVFLK